MRLYALAPIHAKFGNCSTALCYQPETIDSLGTDIKSTARSTFSIILFIAVYY